MKDILLASLLSLSLGLPVGLSTSMAVEDDTTVEVDTDTMVEVDTDTDVAATSPPLSSHRQRSPQKKIFLVSKILAVGETSLAMGSSVLIAVALGVYGYRAQRAQKAARAQQIQSRPRSWPAGYVHLLHVFTDYTLDPDADNTGEMVTLQPVPRPGKSGEDECWRQCRLRVPRNMVIKEGGEGSICRVIPHNSTMMQYMLSMAPKPWIPMTLSLP